QTELDEHEFVIRVEQEPIRGGGLVLADPARVGMSENPLTLDQVQLRKFASLHLYQGAMRQLPPQSGCVVRDPSFDTVLDLEGEDFYDAPVTVLPERYTLMFVTTGLFSGLNFAAHSAFSRVSREVLDQIRAVPRRPEDWDQLPDSERRSLPAFAREVKSEHRLDRGESLVIKGVGHSKRVQTLAKLPHPSQLHARRYVITISNLDKRGTGEDLPHVLQNCAGFLHHSAALDPLDLRGKGSFGLMYNFDHDDLAQDLLGDELERTPAACCGECQIKSPGGVSGAVPVDELFSNLVDDQDEPGTEVGEGQVEHV
ncbi:MAG TPA: hypothetical protein VJ302_07390, partial [Blastocatellia bacterium]|nr:hypothetical protein [Blastocatellia bacterium]